MRAWRPARVALRRAFAADAAAAAEILELREEAEQFKDRRTAAKASAETDRQRHVEQLAVASQYAYTSFAKDLLGVADNLARTKQAGDASERKDVKAKVADADKALHDMLKEFGVVQFEPKPGDAFDPTKHEAMFQMPIPNMAPNTVAHVLRTGYMVRDRVLRAAQVGVAQ